MARRPIRGKEVQNPDRILSNLLKDYVEGKLDDNRVLFRASVVKIDQVGGQLEDDPPNPRNSIQARVITDAMDTYTIQDDLPVFWPIFPHDVMPIKEGEHVYVVFEDPDRKEHGLWIARIPEPKNVESANLVPGSKKYEADSNNGLSSISAEKAVQDVTTDADKIELSSEFVAESVQPFRARIGDRIIEGSNNTIIVLGRDRPSDENSGKQDGAGTIDLVSGRSVAENMDFAKDKSRIYISSLTDVDANLSTANDPGTAVDATAAVVLKSDEIRIIARNGTKIVVEGGDLHLEGANIFLGTKATESLLQGNKFNKLWTKILNMLATHNHPSPVPNSPSPSLASLATPAINDLSNPATGPVLSKTVKTKG